MLWSACSGHYEPTSDGDERRRVVADRRRLVSRLPNPDCQKHHREGERRHLKGDSGKPIRTRLFCKHKSRGEYNSEPPRRAMTPPEGDSHDDRRYELADGIGVGERLTRSRVEVRDQEPCSSIARHMGRRSGGKIDADEDVDNGTT